MGLVDLLLQQSVGDPRLDLGQLNGPTHLELLFREPITIHDQLPRNLVVVSLNPVTQALLDHLVQQIDVLTRLSWVIRIARIGPEARGELSKIPINAADYCSCARRISLSTSTRMCLQQLAAEHAYRRRRATYHVHAHKHRETVQDRGAAT